MGWQNAVEWIGVSLALAGAAIIAARPRLEVVVWGMWLASSILLVAVFASSGSGALMATQVAGIAVNVLGLAGALRSSGLPSGRLFVALRATAIATVVIAAVILVAPASPGPQWAAVALSIAAPMLMASRLPGARYAFVIWASANVLLVTESIRLEHHGFAAMNIAFLAANTYASIRYVILRRPFIEGRPDRS